MIRATLLLLLALPGAVRGNVAESLDDGDISPEALMEDDVCEQDGPDGEACALHLRSLRGQVIRASLKTEDPSSEASEAAQGKEPSLAEASDNSEVAELFQAMDTDKNGEVNEDELSAFMQQDGAPESSPSAASLIEEHDADKSKTLNMAEVGQALEKSGWIGHPYHPFYHPYAHPFHPFRPVYHPYHPYRPIYLGQQESGEEDSDGEDESADWGHHHHHYGYGGYGHNRYGSTWGGRRRRGSWGHGHHYY